jgi:hypothetical protein
LRKHKHKHGFVVVVVIVVGLIKNARRACDPPGKYVTIRAAAKLIAWWATGELIIHYNINMY